MGLFVRNIRGDVGRVELRRLVERVRRDVKWVYVSCGGGDYHRHDGCDSYDDDDCNNDGDGDGDGAMSSSSSLSLLEKWLDVIW